MPNNHHSIGHSSVRFLKPTPPDPELARNEKKCQVIQAVTFLSPIWRSLNGHLAIERVTFSPSQKGHEKAELPGWKSSKRVGK